MKLGYHNQGFFWKGPTYLEDIPDKFGFQFIKSVDMWYSRNPANAERLVAEFGSSLDISERVLQVINLNRKGFIESSAADADISVPVPLGLEFKPFQLAGINFLTKRDSALLADEQGLGKTIQVIGAMNIWKPNLTLVLCPASLKLNWQREIKKWAIPTPNTYVVEPGKMNRTLIENMTGGVLIINYDMLQKLAPYLQAIEWDLVVMDEAQKIKNFKAKRTKVAMKIRSKRRILATGTPIENRPEEIFTLLHYLDPKEWASRKEFINRYCDPHTEWFRGKPKLVTTGASNLEELQWKLRSTLMIRRLKKHVLQDLPDKQRQVIEVSGVSLKHEQEGLAGLKFVKAQTIANMGVLAQIRHDTALAKVPKVNAFLEDALEDGRKIVVFAHHKDVIASIYNHFRTIAVKITGETSQKDRQKAVDDFQGNDDVKLFVGNMVAAGTGLTLTASAHVVFAELDWTPGVMAQAEDRCHRIGQKDSVLIQYLVVADSIDARLAQALVKKQDVINQAVNTEISSVSDELLQSLKEEQHVRATI